MSKTSCDSTPDHTFGHVSNLDGIVSGTDQADLIDAGYDGDPDGDRVDNYDSVLQGQDPQDDLIYGRGGDDTVRAGEGRDKVYGGSDNDALYGGSGCDVIFGGQGADFLSGGTGADWIFGGADPDLIEGISPGDVIYGGSTGLDFDTLSLKDSVPPGGAIRIIHGRNPEDGIVEFYDNCGHRIGTAFFHDIERIVPCFTPGTLIATPTGERPVEELVVGDRVITRDNGVQKIRWVGRRELPFQALLASPGLVPVVIRAGALGRGLPDRDLRVSPNHRVLVNDDRAALYFDDREVLVMAKHLVGLPGIVRDNMEGTSYIHFMFDQHEIVLSNGSWTESFQPGVQALSGMETAAKAELLTLFPELQDPAVGEAHFLSARRSLKRHETAVLFGMA